MWALIGHGASFMDEYAGRGQLILTQMVAAPFPHPDRAEGHKYQEQFFSASEHYSNSTVAIFIPERLKMDEGGVDFVVHFHGWQNDVEGALKKYHLIEQLLESKRNAVLVVPQGPYRASDSFGGKLEDKGGFRRFIEQVMATLPKNLGREVGAPKLGRIILSGHSGGYHVMSAIVEHGGLSEKIREVWLFDALYGQTEKFVGWADREHGRLLNIYTEHGGTKDETEKLLAELKSKWANLFAGKEQQVTSESLAKAQFVFLSSELAHDEVLDKHQTFRAFLEASFLKKM
jgi:hypothetical protein